MRLPQSGDDLAQMVLQRWRWFMYRVRFHPISTDHLPKIVATLTDYARLMRLDKPIGIWLLLWPTLWAVWISGEGLPDPKVFLVFVLGTVLMRSAGCVINDFADRELDPQVRRTQSRPLATGAVSPLEALVLFAILALSALVLVMQLNRLTLLLAVVGAVLTVTYPFLKRFFSLPQFYLGVSFGWGIPMAFAAHMESIPRVAWLLLMANVAWCAVYDTIYAMVDREDDLKIGIRSTAILFGESDRHIIGILQGLTLFALYLVGKIEDMGGWYACGLSVGAIFFVRHLWMIRKREPEQCFKAFLDNHYFGMAVFVGTALDYLFHP
jgi:4-hydroxybenzoate polyprenyltransferase